MTRPILVYLVLLALAVGAIALIVKAVKKLSKSNYTGAVTPLTHVPTESASSSSSSTSSYRGTAKIFINGGAPASGNVMGRISVDGNSMSILYTEAPLEITIAEGNHHIVVEGGRYGDARIDRNINFDILDVWTVDMPGADDADVIRHQMISSSEYRSALSSSGFRVTRKTL